MHAECAETPLVAVAQVLHTSSGYRQIDISIYYYRCAELQDVWHQFNVEKFRIKSTPNISIPDRLIVLVLLGLAWLGFAFNPICLALEQMHLNWHRIQHCDLSISSFAISFVIYLNFFALWIFCVIHLNECANRYINALCSIAWKISIFPPCVSTRNRRKEMVLPHSAVQCGVKLLEIGCNLIHDKINSIIFYSMRSHICSKTNWCWTRPNGEWWLLLRWALLIKHS